MQSGAEWAATPAVDRMRKQALRRRGYGGGKAIEWFH